ncbi:MAG: hypothetical protein IIW48_07255 [Clostridia bacterium]|nr:hypothetical protein [Clostridia bacterium]
MTKSTFDQILKDNVVNCAGYDCFSPTGYGAPYPTYYSRYFFNEFVTQMITDYPTHYEKYRQGRGSELVSINSKPPKMSCVGSSSRFCYLAFRNYHGVDFEHDCPIAGIRGTAPQMDTYFEDKNIFIEVKCHEIFDAHKMMLSNQYYNLLFGEGNDFGLETEGSEIVKKSKAFEIPIDKFGLEGKLSMIDFKQFICHLLGIKSHKKADETATLIYLFFKPKTTSQAQRDEINILFAKLKSEIKSVFESTPIKAFVQKNNIELKAVAEYAEVMSPLTTENAIILYQ